MKINQILAISLQSLKSNRLRTALTILGVVVGIFSIIVIMTILTMLQNSIDEGLSSLGKNTFQIQNTIMYLEVDQECRIEIVKI